MSETNIEKVQPTGIQDRAERNVWLLAFLTFLTVSVAGIVEIVPLFYLDSALPAKNIPGVVWDRGDKSLKDWQAGDGVRPLKPLELAGRDIYQKEGCYLCHSQMIRPFRDEKERYGHYSLASESMYDHPMQWGSKRTGPDLARVGGKYSDEWQIAHLIAPRSVVPESVMPNYPWFMENTVDGEEIKAHMRGLRIVGVPYTDADIETASEITGKTEMEAMVAYLQVLGTMIKFQEGVEYRE
ncbi:MAG: cytochrome-c oxidase, cbb3-type subunit II [Gammaproteobacteria bacterium]|nr:cytochrome-c oxidase, cbb3-type subunit II [Gammaproteobacteria bacterium]